MIERGCSVRRLTLMMFVGIFMRGAIRKATLEDMNRFEALGEGTQE